MNSRLLKNASPLAALPGAPACFSEGAVVSQFHLEKYLPPGDSFVLNQLLFGEANMHTLFESNRKTTLKEVALAVGSCSFPSLTGLWPPCHPLGLEVKTMAALPGALAPLQTILIVITWGRGAIASSGSKPGMLLNVLRCPGPPPITTFLARMSAVVGKKACLRTPNPPARLSAAPSQGTTLLLSLSTTHGVLGFLEFLRKVRDVPEQMVMLGIFIFQVHVAWKDDGLRRAPETHTLIFIYFAFPESS